MELSKLHTLFSKDELVSISQELDIAITGNTRELVKRIYDDLMANGIVDGDVSEELMSFMFEAGLIDEDGNTIEQVATGGDQQPQRVSANIGLVEGDPQDAPPCYGAADDRDPGCRRCKLMKLCIDKRISIRPPCFGNSFLMSSEECMVCIEAYNCSVVFEDAKRALNIAK